MAKKPKRKLVKGVDWHGYAFKRHPTGRHPGRFLPNPILYVVKPKMDALAGTFVKVKIVEVK